MGSRQLQVVWSAQARLALDEAVAYVAEDSPTAAIQLLEQALAAGVSLRDMNERGRVVPEASDSDVREIFVQRYRLIYEVSEREVRVLAFLHGARDFAKWQRDE